MGIGIQFMVTEPHVVFSQNITHNLAKMAIKAGVYDVLWQGEGVKTAQDLVEPLRRALCDMRQFPAKYRAFNDPGGWGTYGKFVPWLQKLLDACYEWPDAEVEHSR